MGDRRCTIKGKMPPDELLAENDHGAAARKHPCEEERAGAAALRRVTIEAGETWLQALFRYQRQCRGGPARMLLIEMNQV